MARRKKIPVVSRMPKTKAAKAAKVGKVMDEFKSGKLRSGSKKGPKVTNPAQAIAIGLSESGQSNRQRSARKKRLAGAEL